MRIVHDHQWIKSYGLKCSNNNVNPALAQHQIVRRDLFCLLSAFWFAALYTYYVKVVYRLS